MNTCHEIMHAKAKSYEEETETVPKSFTEKKKTCKTQTFYILLVFLLITMALLIAVRIYCYPIKNKSKQKHLLPYYIINNKLINDKLINVL